MRVINFDASEVKQAARGFWLNDIFPAAGLTVNRNIHGPCPACGGTDRFRCDDRFNNGDYYCNQCGAGDGFNLLKKVHGWPFPEMLRFVAETIGLSLDGAHKNLPARDNPAITAPEFTASNPNPYAVQQLKRIRSTAIDDTGRIRRYQLYRGITFKLNASYNRFLEHEKEPGTGKFYPCAVYPIRTVAGEVMGYHKLYLDDKTDGKAPVPQPKRMTQKLYDRAYTGCAVWLGQPDGKLLITEGVETGLAVMQMTGNSVWCSLTASMMKNVIVPSCVHTVEVYGDNDANGVGQAAAQILCNRLQVEGKICRVMLPPITGHDWLDVLNSGKEVA